MGEKVDELTRQDGWQADGDAARVHYQGGSDQYSIEYYEPSSCVLYWKVPPNDGVAVPVGRHTVPQPLRDRIRMDLDAANIDPTVESREL
jgi:hypothetical protein